MVDARHATGQRGEDEAAALLRRTGYSIIARNWRHGGLELDIICETSGTIVFVEVKTRAANGLTSPTDALTHQKRQRLIRAARAWLAAADAWDRACRFDLVCVTQRGATCTLEHITDAFDLTETLGGGDTSWQPW